MNNLTLLNKLGNNEMVTLILRPKSGDQLEYYIIAVSMNYSLVASGDCTGTINGNMLSFTVSLSSIVSLLDKDYKFQISYANEELIFSTEKGTIQIRPLAVEFMDEQSMTALSKFLRFNEYCANSSKSDELKKILEEDLRQETERYESLEAMNLTPPTLTPMNLTGVIQPANPVTYESDTEHNKRISELKRRINDLETSAPELAEVDMKPFARLASIAGKNHELVNFCGDFAVTELDGIFIFERLPCIVQAISGVTISKLISDSAGADRSGNFRVFENSLVYSAGAGSEQVTVFIEKYLPSSKVDFSLVTRKENLEKYSITLKSQTRALGILQAKFPIMKFDLGSAKVVLNNERGETAELKFTVEKAETIELNKMVAGVAGMQTSKVVMSSICIPKSVQQLLPLFKESMTIYIKAKKIVLQSGTTYVVFGRTKDA